MSVAINKTAGLFSLKTKNTEYQIQADKYGVLKHIWYGKKVNTDMSYLLNYTNVGFSGNPYDAKNDRTYSLDTMPLEYACKGNGDYRITAVSVTHPNGSRALDLRFKSYEAKKGKYSITGLPAVYANESEAETLEITLQDKAADIIVILRYGVLPEYDIITRSTKIINRGNTKITLDNAASLCLDLPCGNMDWLHFHGRHNMERMPQRRPLFNGIHEISSTRGMSSHQHNPSVIICSPECNEQNGECYGMFFVYSGSFRIQIERDQLDQLRVIMGIHPELFTWELEPGGSFETPEAVMTYSGTGMSTLSHNFHKVIREHICRGKYKLAQRPVLINNWEATYFNFNSRKILRIARQAAKLGVNMIVLDDGWFGKRNSDNSGLGDWFPNEKKLRGSLGKLADKIKKLGMSFGLWFEPEMISEDSDLYRKCPGWALTVPDREPVLSRNQLVLDMSRKDVLDHLYDSISGILKSADISYIKWDMNRSISDWFSSILPIERQGELPHRYMLGLYSLLERLTSEFPDVLFEGCSGGGGRFDAGMLYYCPQIWCSDDTDAYERTKIQYGTSFIYPISAVGSHVSIVPNHQTGRITPLSSRAVTAMAGSFGYELDPKALTYKEKKAVSEQIATYKKYCSLIHNGYYYRLSDPMKDNFALWEYVSEDGNEVLVHGMVFRSLPNMNKKSVRLAGLDPDTVYEYEKNKCTGTALMNGGILLPNPTGDYQTIEIYIRKADYK